MQERWRALGVRHIYHEFGFNGEEAVFYPPFEGAGMLDEDEIIKDIQHLGVKNGIKTDVVKDFLAHRRYGHRYVIAVGTAATEGSDGYIEYKFNTELNRHQR